MNFKKNLVNISVVLLTVIGVGSAHADDHEDRKGGKDKQKAEKHHTVAGKFKRLDADESGTLTLNEMTSNLAEKAQKKMTRADSNNDGAISLQEYLVAKPHVHDYSSIAEALVECVAAIKEQTGDSNIVVPDASQFTSPETKFASIDVNSDGGLTLNELQNHMQTRVSESFNAMDADSNGEVTQDEFVAAAQMKKATKKAVKQCAEDLLDDDE
jgi:Ca2+-binding EF-hand superfamily protein